MNVRDFPMLSHCKPGSRLPSSPHFPPGRRFLHVENNKGGEIGCNDMDGVKVIVGIPVEPKKYLEHVFKLTHPALMSMILEPDSEAAVCMNVGCPLALRGPWVC